LKLGLDTYSYRYAAGLWEYIPRENPAMGLDHLLQKAVELNLDGLRMADARHLESLDYGYVSEVRRKADSLGLYLELGTEGTNPDHLQTMVRTAHVVGSPVVRTTAVRERPASPRAMDQLLSQARAELADVLAVCDRYGVALALESGGELRTDEMLSLLELVDSPWVGISFNTGNGLALLDDPLESARSFGPLIKTVQLTDYQIAARSDGFALIGCELGAGAVDLQGILDALRHDAPRANLNIGVSATKRVCAALEDEYLSRVPEASAGELGRTLRLVRDRGLSSEPDLLVERGASEQEILAAEEDMVARSVRWAEQALGRAGPEPSEIGG
jgi:sugar phosphate isomerase/epimerase